MQSQTTIQFIIKICCIALLLSSSIIISVPYAKEHIDSPNQQIHAVFIDWGVHVINSVASIALLLLFSVLYCIAKPDVMISSFTKIRHFLRSTIYILIICRFLNPVKFQSRFMVKLLCTHNLHKGDMKGE